MLFIYLYQIFHISVKENFIKIFVGTKYAFTAYEKHIKNRCEGHFRVFKALFKPISTGYVIAKNDLKISNFSPIVRINISQFVD